MKHLTIATVVLGLAVGGIFLAGTQTASAGMEKYKVVNSTIPKSLTGKAGNAAKGKKLTINRKKGNCLACHVITALAKQPFHGNLGPPLNGVGSRLTAAEIRLRIVNPKIVNPDSIMPAFYKSDGFHRLQKKWKGKTIIGAQDVEDIVAYMLTLK